MTTTVPSKNDWDKALVRFSAIEARLDALEAKPVEPPVTEPPVEDPPVVTPPVTEPPVVAVGVYTRAQRTGALPAIKRTPADLVAVKLILPFASPRSPITYPAYTRGPYGEVGLSPDMGTTGERQEIGLFTDAQGEWLLGGSPNNMLVQAEAHADVPVHYGRVDLSVTPNANVYERADVGSPWFDKSGYPVRPESAHYPSLTYLPYLATGDLFYLEELQAEATFNLIQGPPQYRFDLNDGVYQTRAFAWLLRSMTCAFLATREAEKTGLPDNLLPSSYWKGQLDRFRDLFNSVWVKNPKAVVQNTHAAITVEVACIDPWMQDYLGFVMGFMVWAGLEDWRENYEWHAQQAILRTAFGAKGVGYKWFPTADAQDYAALIAKDGSVDDANYKAFWRGNLKVQVLNGVSGAEEAFAVADKLATYIPYKWAV